MIIAFKYLVSFLDEPHYWSKAGAASCWGSEGLEVDQVKSAKKILLHKQTDKSLGQNFKVRA